MKFSLKLVSDKDDGYVAFQLIDRSRIAFCSLRIQLLARDVIVATREPRDLSVRNALQGTVTEVGGDDAGSDLIFIDIGGALIMSRVTRAASRALALAPGMAVWALVKSVSLRRHVLARGTPPGHD